MLNGGIAAGISHTVFIIPDQTDHADTTVIECLKIGKISVSGCTVFHGEQRRNFILRRCFPNILGVTDRHKKFRHGSNLAIKEIYGIMKPFQRRISDLVAFRNSVCRCKHGKALEKRVADAELFRSNMSLIFR